MRLQDILNDYSPGDKWFWEDEFAYLRDKHATRLYHLAVQIVRLGIQQPVLLGDDGRVWDGHHRLCIAYDFDIYDVPVEVAGDGD